MTVGKVWLEEEVASSPGRWWPGLDPGARGLPAGSRRECAPEPGLERIPGASGAGFEGERGGSPEANSEVGERHRPCSRVAAASPPPALASGAPVEEPGPWSPLGEAALGGLDAWSGAASPRGRRQKLRNSFCSSGRLRMPPAILFFLLLGKKPKRNSSPGTRIPGLSPTQAVAPFLLCGPSFYPASPCPQRCRRTQGCLPQPPGSLHRPLSPLPASGFPSSPHPFLRPCCRTFLWGRARSHPLLHHPFP